jgi:hypothetical protein
MDASNFAQMFKFFSNLCKVPVESYITERTPLVFPIIPLPILRKLLVTAARRFAEEDTVLLISQHVIVVGDIHGHILDLLRVDTFSWVTLWTAVNSPLKPSSSF